MKIKVQQCLINSIPSVIVYTEDWSRQELDAILRFGEPEIDIGGKFDKHPRKDPDPSGDDPGIHDGRLSHQVKLFFDKLSEVTIENTGTSDALQKWLLDLKEAIDVKTPEHMPDDSNDEGYDDYSETDDYFTMPTIFKKIRSGFPILVAFHKDVFQNPQRIAQLWADEIARRIAIEVKGLRYLGTLFTKEETYEI